MIKEDVKHIFDRSACLTKKQIDAYLAGNMITEEVYAVEHHINGCPLCSMALDGMQLRKDALDVMGQLNAEFLKGPLEAAAQPPVSTTTSYLKNLKPREGSSKPLLTGVKIVAAVAACAGILWFVQKAGSNKTNETAPQEETVAAIAPPETEERSVTVEEPLTADTQPVVEETTLEPEPQPQTPAEPEAQPVKIGPPPPPVENKKTATTEKPPVKPTTTPPAKPAPGAVKPVKPPVTGKPTQQPPVAKPQPATPPPSSPVKEEPKSQPVVKEEPKPQPVAKEEQKPTPPPATPKKDDADELPSDPLAAGKALMDKRNYNAAIGKMRNEMRSNNKARRQEAVMMVAKCYQQLGNKERAKELLSSIIDEGGPEKKNAKKMLKEVDKNAKTDD